MEAMRGRPAVVCLPPLTADGYPDDMRYIATGTASVRIDLGDVRAEGGKAVFFPEVVVTDARYRPTAVCTDEELPAVDAVNARLSAWVAGDGS